MASSEKTFGGGDLRQYEVFENPSRATRDFAPYVVVLQSHLLDGLPSAVAAPLLTGDRAERFPYLSIEVLFDGRHLVLSLHELATFDGRQLRRPIGSLVEYQDEIGRGLQRLFSGF